MPLVRAQEVPSETPLFQACPDRRFEQLKAHLVIAFQPIVCVETGQCYALEALMRGVDRIGFESPLAVLTWAEEVGKLAAVDALLRWKTLAAFKGLDLSTHVRLFINLDNRLFATPRLTADMLLADLDAAGVSPSALVLEVSERHRLVGGTALEKEFDACRTAGIALALDDFGIELSNLNRLHELSPTFIKLDKQFIQGLGRAPRQMLFVRGIIALVRSLGVKVIAEGIEDLTALKACRDVGCQYVQGYFIAPPALESDTLRPSYDVLSPHKTCVADGDPHEHQFLLEHLSQPPILTLDMAMSEALALFRAHDAHSHFPVLDTKGVPLGIITERMLRRYLYSPYGYALLHKRTVADQLGHLLNGCLTAPLGTSLDHLLKRSARSKKGLDEGEGVCALERGRYIGFWTPDTILSAFQWRDMTRARDENPLTRLPGNHVIEQALRKYLTQAGPDWSTIYFDLDHFKPFNDHYGFRRGDEVLLLFTQLLRDHFDNASSFLGHVGGDDFVLLMPCHDLEQTCNEVTAFLEAFALEVRTLYSATDLAEQGFMGVDRANRSRWFPLLTASAAMLVIRGACCFVSEKRVLEASAQLKKAAKAHGNMLCCASVWPGMLSFE